MAGGSGLDGAALQWVETWPARCQPHQSPTASCAKVCALKIPALRVSNVLTWFGAGHPVLGYHVPAASGPASRTVPLAEVSS